jgi:hypothetical protein
MFQLQDIHRILVAQDVFFFLIFIEELVLELLHLESYLEARPLVSCSLTFLNGKYL